MTLGAMEITANQWIELCDSLQLKHENGEQMRKPFALILKNTSELLKKLEVMHMDRKVKDELREPKNL
jgi:hypothetical protein